MDDPYALTVDTAPNPQRKQSSNGATLRVSTTLSTTLASFLFGLEYLVTSSFLDFLSTFQTGLPTVTLIFLRGHTGLLILSIISLLSLGVWFKSCTSSRLQKRLLLLSLVNVTFALVMIPTSAVSVYAPVFMSESL